jgi:hypothetical protein
MRKGYVYFAAVFEMNGGLIISVLTIVITLALTYRAGVEAACLT